MIICISISNFEKKLTLFPNDLLTEIFTDIRNTFVIDKVS